MTPHQAYRLVRNALKRGELVRPEKCSRCGANPKTSDGRSAIQARKLARQELGITKRKIRAIARATARNAGGEA